MPQNRKYIVEYVDFGSEDMSLPPFNMEIVASDNADARTVFKRYMKTEFGVVESKDYRINSITLSNIPRAAPVPAKGKMSVAEADRIIGNRARWEVLKMKKALSILELMNTPEENERLEACKVWLKSHKK